MGSQLSTNRYGISLLGRDIRSIQGQAHHEGDAFFLAVCLDTAAVQLHDFLGNGKPQAGAPGVGGTGGIQAEKLFKDPLQFFGGDGSAMVAEQDFDVGIPAFHGEEYPASSIAVINGISDEVVEYPFQLVPVTEDMNIRRDLRIPA